jgi:ribosomal protein L17
MKKRKIRQKSRYPSELDNRLVMLENRVAQLFEHYTRLTTEEKAEAVKEAKYLQQVTQFYLGE